MIKNILFKKLFSAISIFSVLLNILLPLLSGQLAYAQEVTPTPIPTPSVEASPTPIPDVTPAPSADSQPSPTFSPSPEPTPSVLPTTSPEPSSSLEPSPTPAPELTPSPEVTPSASVAPTAEEIWQDTGDGKWETINNVELNKDYTSQQNDKVKVKFTAVSGDTGKLSIKEVKLTAEQISQTGALSETAYEITSTMADGTFFYDLTLPIPAGAENKTIEVKSSETTDQIGNAQKVSEPEEKNIDTVTVHGLNHFTVFILTVPPSDNTQSILINEVLPNPSVGLEWVELYNNTASAINLATGTGWTIDSATGTPQSLSALGSIPAGGLKVFESPAGWISNTGPETVTVSNDTGTAIDTVTISLTSPGFAVNRYPTVGESVGRSSDGGGQWIIFTVPTKGTTNVLAAPANKAVASTIEAYGYPSWYADNNGTRVAPCLEGSDPRCAMAAEPGFDPANPTVLPDNFPSEFFYWSADALMDTPGGRAKLILADEGAFGNAAGTVAAGDQITFGRTRIRGGGLTPNTDYTFTHPYGSVVIRTDGVGNFRSDGDDVGCAIPNCDFTAALGSPVFNSFLRWDTGAPAGYLGDGVTEHTVTGSPTGNNFFRIEGPGLPAGGIQTNNFVVLGKLFVNPVTPPPGCIDIAPDAPVLVSPANGAVGVPNSPVLNWNSITSFGTNCLGSNNQFEIFLDPGNVDPTTSWGVVSETTVSKLILALASNTTYSWKIRAKNGILSTESPVQTFTTTSAVTNRAVSPNIDPNNNFATWYGDDNGVQIAPCLDGTDPGCVLPAAGDEPQWDPAQPTNFPTNFPSEFFYWIAESDFLATPGGGKTSIRMALEGAFANAIVPGDQMVFGRIRLTGTKLTPNSTYTVTHPYGVDTYVTDDLGTVRRNTATEDIGCVPGPGVFCDFSLALPSRVFGGFLRQPAAPDGYLGDAITLGPIIGSPLGQNFFRIEGPGLPSGGLQTTLFTVSGKVFVPPPPPPGGCVDSAPDPVILIAPANGAANTSTNPALSWSAPASFGTNCAGNIDRFQILLDQGNVDPATLKATVLSGQTTTSILNLLPGTTYSWKVRASNGVLTADSLVRTFTTTTATTNRAVSLTNNVDNGYPDWYRDDLGVSVVPCLDGADPQCVLPAVGDEPNFDPTQTTVFPSNFPTEFFYWVADSDRIDLPGGGRFSARFALEGAFLNGNPVPGDQMVFGRIRVIGTGLTPNSTYTVTHPYGVDIYETDATGVLRRNTSTEDIGCQAAPCDFSLALGSRVMGGFLKWDTGAPVGYLGDAAVSHIVTGSPTSNNFVRIEGPGLPAGGLETNLFTVSGKLFAPVGGVDVTAPVITVLGANPVDVLVGSVYNDAGATALDNVDGDVTANIVTTGLPINTSAVGTFTVTYSVSDAAGNPAVATRTVNVVATPPVDITAPNLVSFTSTTADGTYGPGASINITANFDEPVGVDSRATVTLDTGVPIEMVALSLVSGATLTGTYVVGPSGSGQNSPDLTVAAITSMNVTDAAGNLQTSTVLPAANIADTSAIIIDTTLPPGVTTGTITIIKDAVPDSTQDFGFRVRNGAFDQNFLLDDDGSVLNDLSNTKVFGGLTPGVYTAQENGPANNWVLSTILCFDPDSGTTVDMPSRTATINLIAGGNVICTFTNTLNRSIAGMKFEDINGNGIKETGEPGLSNWTIYLDVNDNGVLDQGETSTLTDASGNYLFSNLNNAVYNVREVVLPGWSQTTPASGKYIVDLGANNSVANQDFGNMTTPPPPPTTGTITVIKDAVPNDTQDFGFRLRDNAALSIDFLLDDDGDNFNVLSNTRVFADLAQGSYNLQETSLGSFVLDSLVCQDPDSGTTADLSSRTATIDLDAGENVICTFTNALRNSISGMKFRDLNANGIKDAGEPGLSGWTIFLDENDNAILDAGETSVVTNADGNYQLTNVPGGTQNVREVLPDGWLQTLPVGGKYTLVVTSSSSFINQNFGNTPVVEILGSSFTYTGESESSALTATPLEDITINVPTGSGISTIVIPAGTVISKSDGSPFDMALLGASEALAGSFSGLSSGTVVDGALQWGIPNSGLIFSQPINVSIFVGNEFNGQTLSILRSVSGTSGWTSDGIVPPATCTVSAGICSFQATLASFYAATHTESIPTPTPTPAPAPASGGNSGGGGGSASAPSCNDPAAGGAPTLLSATVSGANQVTLTWSKAADPVTHYVISYGLTPGNPLFGNPNVGGKDTTSYTVKDLSGGTTYYFRVRAANGCNGGAYSNERAATPGGPATAGGPAAGFTAGVLGTQVGGALGDENTGTGTGGPSIEESPSPSPEVLGDGNVGIGLGQQQAGGGQSFLGFVQTQISLLGILAGLILLFVLNIFYRRA